MTNIRRSLAATALVLLGTTGHALAQSCAMCAASFGPNDPTSRAISWSILFLMAAPYTIVLTAAGILFYMSRRAPGRRRAAIIDLAKAARLLRRPATVTGHQGDTP
jgi:hypothetical protein